MPPHLPGPPSHLPPGPGRGRRLGRRGPGALGNRRRETACLGSLCPAGWPQTPKPVLIRTPTQTWRPAPEAARWGEKGRVEPSGCVHTGPSTSSSPQPPAGEAQICFPLNRGEPEAKAQRGEVQAGSSQPGSGAGRPGAGPLLLLISLLLHPQKGREDALILHLLALPLPGVDSPPILLSQFPTGCSFCSPFLRLCLKKKKTYCQRTVIQNSYKEIQQTNFKKTDNPFVKKWGKMFEQDLHQRRCPSGRAARASVLVCTGGAGLWGAARAAAEAPRSEGPTPGLMLCC